RTADYGLRIQEAVREVAQPVFFAVLIIIVVFTPVFSLEGVEGKLFKPMALSIVFALITSLLVALLVVPALASFAFANGALHRVRPVLRPIARLYRKRLAWIMMHPRRVLGGAAVALALSLLMLPFLGTELVPELEEGTLDIRVTMAPSTSLD